MTNQTTTHNPAHSPSPSPTTLILAAIAERRARLRRDLATGRIGAAEFAGRARELAEAAEMLGAGD
jgi:hypothetical protein